MTPSGLRTWGPGRRIRRAAPRGSTARRSRIDRFMASRKHSHSAADSALDDAVDALDNVLKLLQ